ncbi:tRNA pseudouridine32 synthase / 23S rRNA pseudouridine746 synthase [Hyunsoonleella jejuensis]|uniref:tRNA pseudouridine32 synthase / 23S rRNA pseudouridine746 synthase n=1 Tax=Hyunsoonleella jejuensis TaxID=419940 RepID=A0A1H9GT39_9FLAO|nr:pseudouridine synthase [Hyunsoonleella jejuensis]SEQ53240.1 tRNA pseudouridine32 synthase / 23S rRNA pseudouridine746 synthase [Hyunsoonleella jejuensis]
MQHPNFTDTFFHKFTFEADIVLPKQFTFPFYYEPHELSVLAAEDLQRYLESQTDFKHNFGLHPDTEGLVIGKMFGVMVVQQYNGDLGYLAAFSGKLAESNYHKGFVPTVYNTLDETGFYKKGEAELNRLNAEIETLENASELKQARLTLDEFQKLYNKELAAFKADIKTKKKTRNLKRESAKTTLSSEAFEVLLEGLKSESIYYHFRLKDLKKDWEAKIEAAKHHLDGLLKPIEALKEKRATLSASLQKRLHEQYRFLNAEGNTKDLLDIFKDAMVPPPAGSGECAAPKLFQYAYENNLKPIAMAEFWWGASPKSEVRKHKQFYPSCRSKCEPILGHMMQGLDVEDNPIQTVSEYNAPLDIVYEDDYLLLVNKPHEFLSVPGKHIQESVLTRMKRYLPKAKGPLLVHRLDMSTSGLLLVAKNEKTHKNLQKQFIERAIKKRYVALLDGEVSTKSGTIDLPLRVDLDNRPQQLVCYQHGKPAKTKYEVVGVENGKTRIYFYPITGRTHQLRVHAAHSGGLNMAIIGDDLYGVKGERLCLHAERLTFIHPVTQQVLDIFSEVPF